MRNALIIVAIFAAGCPPVTAHAADKVNIAYIGGTADVGFYIADARGYLKQEDVDAKFTVFNSAAAMVAPLATGEIDVGSGTVGAGTYNALARGIGIRAVADKARNKGDYSYQSLVVRKSLWDSGEVRSIKDLKGRKFAMTTQGGNEAAVLDEALRKVGLSIADVEETNLSMPQQVIAFRNGAIDASFLPEPFLQQAIASGTVASIAPASELRNDDVTGVIIYSDHLIKERPQVARRMMKAYIRGLRDYVDALKGARLAGPGAEDVIDIISRYSVVKDKAVLRSIIPHYVDPNGEVGAASLQKDWEFYKAHGFIEGDVTVSQLIDPSWAQAAVRDLGPYKAEVAMTRALMQPRDVYPSNEVRSKLPPPLSPN